MRFRPTRVVGVTNKEELDSALLSADQVIVEGDDQLLSYAAAKASQDPKHSRVDIEIAGRSISIGRDALSNVRVTGDRNTTSAVEGVSNIEPLPSPPSISFHATGTSRSRPRKIDRTFVLFSASPSRSL